MGGAKRYPSPYALALMGIASLHPSYRIQLRVLAARCARGMLEVCPRKSEGAGNAGCLLHPRSRVQDALKNAHTSIQVQPEQPGIPCAMVLRLMPRSPRRRIRFASVADELKVRVARLSFANLRRLDASHGRQDHTVLPYAASSAKHFNQPSAGRPKIWRRRLSAVRLRAVSAHGRPPCEHLSRLTLPRPPQPAPTFVTMANAPLLGTGWREL
jgi:hypothetical protein